MTLSTLKYLSLGDRKKPKKETIFPDESRENSELAFDNYM